MIAVIGAMETEIDVIRGLLSGGRDESIKGLNITIGVVKNREVLICRCGVGKVCAAAAAAYLLTRYSVNEVINVGVAGGISPLVKKLDVVIADRTIQHDLDGSAVGMPRDQLFSGESGYFDCDAGLVASLYKIAGNARNTAYSSEPNTDREPAPDSFRDSIYNAAREAVTAHIGVIATGDKFVAKKTDAEDINKTFNALACDMESAAIAQVAAMFNVKFASMRSISDGADDDAVEDFEVFVRRAADISAGILQKYLYK